MGGSKSTTNSNELIYISIENIHNNTILVQRCVHSSGLNVPAFSLNLSYMFQTNTMAVFISDLSIAPLALNYYIWGIKSATHGPYARTVF